MLKYALVIPFHNACEFLPTILPPLRSLGEHWEILLVDDASTDESGAIAQQLLPRARYVRVDNISGPAHARNLGVYECSSDIVVFQDSDVLATSQTLQSLVTQLEGLSDFCAAYGSYDDTPRASRTVSRFRNLLHHYVHQSSAGPIPSFWSGFGAVKRASFEAIGGFDSQQFERPSIEDIEFGARLWRADHKIVLLPDVQVTHLKDWTLWEFVKTDIYRRALPWTQLILEGRAVSNNLNLKQSFLVPTLLLGLALGFLATTLLLGAPTKLACFPALLYLISNGPIYRFFSRHQLLTTCVPLLALHHLCAVTGAALAVLTKLGSKISNFTR